MRRGWILPLLAAGLAAPASAQVAEDAWFPGTSSITEREIVPPAYRGRWAASQASCRDPDSTERMEILAGGVDGWESGGRLERVTQTGQERSIRLKLAYEGEGEFWDAIEVWTLDASGNVLAITNEATDTTFRRVRCRPEPGD